MSRAVAYSMATITVAGSAHAFTRFPCPSGANPNRNHRLVKAMRAMSQTGGTNLRGRTGTLAIERKSEPTNATTLVMGGASIVCLSLAGVTSG